MHAPRERRALVLETSRDHLQPEVEEVPEHRLQVEALGPADLGVLGRDQARQIDVDVDLQRRVLEQIRHHHLLVGVALQLELDPHIVGGHVANVHERRQPAAERHVADALHELGLVDGIGDARDDDRLARARRVARFPGGPETDGARPGAVDLLDLLRRVQDLAAGGEVGALDPAAQLHAGELVVVEKLEQRRADLAHVVRRDVGRHADGNAGRAVDEQIRDARREHDRFRPRPVEVGAHCHGVLLELEQQLIGEAGEPGFRVAICRGGIAVERSEVPRTVDEGVAQREGLRHSHQGVVHRGIAVRMVVAQHGADDGRRLAMLGVGPQVLLPHRVEDAPLHGLQTVADVGQGAGRDDRQGVVQIACACRLVQRDLPVAARRRTPGRRRRRRGRSARLGLVGVRQIEQGEIGIGGSALGQDAGPSWSSVFRLRATGCPG